MQKIILNKFQKSILMHYNVFGVQLKYIFKLADKMEQNRTLFLKYILLTRKNQNVCLV